MRIALFAVLLAISPFAFAELPPEVYAAMQRDAPELLQLQITDVDIDRDFNKPRGCGIFEFEIERHVTARAKVVSVIRSKAGVRPGALIEIRYTSLKQCEGWSGAGPIPVVEEGTRVFAYLKKTERGFTDAARGASFVAGIPK